MPVSHAVTNQFEAELDEGDHPRLCLTDGARGAALQSDPGLPEASCICPAELEQFRAERGLGCARGVLWALFFEAALVAAAGIYWLLR